MTHITPWKAWIWNLHCMHAHAVDEAGNTRRETGICCYCGLLLTYTYAAIRPASHGSFAPVEWLKVKSPEMPGPCLSNPRQEKL